jgi:peptide/nickel transport system ATP-binding protein
MTRDTAAVVRGLEVRLRSGEAIVNGVDLDLFESEILGVVGESGAGKTTMALALLGYAAPGLVITAGKIAMAGGEVTSAAALRGLRGTVVSYVPQHPGTALNPSLSIRACIRDVLAAHSRARLDEGAVTDALTAVGLDPAGDLPRRYPHELSGGQQQRVCIAMALVCQPTIVVLDEPTTGLDVVAQARILDELTMLRDERNVSMVYVTHDLAVVAQVADRIAVMYAGGIVELGATADVLQHPRHPYTRALVAAIPDHTHPAVLEPLPGISVGVGERPRGCAFEPRCSQRVQRCTVEMPPAAEVGGDHLVRCFESRRTPALSRVLLALKADSGVRPESPKLQVEELQAEHGSGLSRVAVVTDVGFAVSDRECVALVGESGSGKTTIARVIAGLHAPAHGEVLLDGVRMAGWARSRTADQLRRIQLIFQNPADALNPRHTVRAALVRNLRTLRGLSRAEAAAEVNRLLDSVRIAGRLGDRYPPELSGGERQRVAIARALAAVPEVIICDEITSALDVSVQAAILELLGELRREFGLSLLFITHDLGVVASIADRVVVLEAGRICETGAVADVLRRPSQPYTRRLLAAAPSMTPTVQRWRTDAPSGAPQSPDASVA